KRRLGDGLWLAALADGHFDLADRLVGGDVWRDFGDLIDHFRQQRWPDNRHRNRRAQRRVIKRRAFWRGRLKDQIVFRAVGGNIQFQRRDVLALQQRCQLGVDTGKLFRRWRLDKTGVRTSRQRLQIRAVDAIAEADGVERHTAQPRL